jgi:hypothetical protein
MIVAIRENIGQIGGFPMRIVLLGLSACALLIAGGTSVAAPPQPAPVDGAQLILTPQVLPSLDFDKEIAGLPMASRPEVLTWERVYSLAVVKARAGSGSLWAALDPAALAAAAARVGVADFARFRAEFLAGDPASGLMTFRDPSAAILRLLVRLQTIDNARRAVAIHENLFKLLVERVQGESSGLNRIDIDTVVASLLKARQKLAAEIRQFRNGLDELKVGLGLSPRAPVVLDRARLAAFRAVFDSVERWTRQPQRHLEDLPPLIERLPAVGEVVLDGQPILGAIRTNPDRWDDVLTEDVLTAAVQLAEKNRSGRERPQAAGDAAVQLELRIRRRIRDLSETERAYGSEKRSYELAVRLQDQAFERLLAPSAGFATSRSLLLHGLIEHVTQVCDAENRLINLWTSFRAERLALYRDMGVLPYNDWNAFYTDLSAGPHTAGAVPAVPRQVGPGNVQPAPAPPSPPGT